MRGKWAQTGAPGALTFPPPEARILLKKEKDPLTVLHDQPQKAVMHHVKGLQ